MNKGASKKKELRVIFFGNPGSGKSTLLNSLAGKKVFENGFSFLSGLTKLFETYYSEADNIVFCDTPGLADVKTRTEAANQIENGLKQEKSANYKLFFIIQLRNGRIIHEDLATMFTVLKAIHFEKQNTKELNYGIIFNDLSTREFELLTQQSGRVLKELKNTIFSGPESIYATERFFAIPHCENVEWGLPSFIAQNLKQFVTNCNEYKINSSEISKLDTVAYEGWIEYFSKKLRAVGSCLWEIWKSIPNEQKEKLLLAGSTALIFTSHQNSSNKEKGK